MEIKRIQTDRPADEDFVIRKLENVTGKAGDGKALLFGGFIFGICLSGNAAVRINGIECDVSRGSVFVVLPKHVFYVDSCSDDIDVRLIFISFGLAGKLPVSPNFESLKNTEANPCIDSGEWLDDLSWLCCMLEGHDYSSAGRQAIRMSLTCTVALILSALYENRQADVRKPLTRQEQLTNKFFELLFQYFETERSVAFYAGKLCVTPKYLSVAIRSVSGCTVQKWINEIVLAEAKRYLCTTELTIQQISDKLNFASPSSFVRFFRQHTLTTPLAYRKD